MQHQLFSAFLGAAIAVSALLAPPAIAQQSDEPASVVEEILVTAQRRESNLQQTAVSVSAFTSEDLEARHIEDIQSVGLVEPSMQVAFYQGEAQVFIRGVGTPITVGGTDASTAIYRDGEFLSRASASIPGFFDVSQVEVLKGPQGTLYGRNATAGSVLVTSKQPTEEFDAQLSATAGNFGRFDLFGAVSGPLNDANTVLYRLAAQKSVRDGWTDLNTGSGSVDIEDKDETYLRGVLEFRPSDALTLSLSVDYYEADDRNQTFVYVADSFGLTDPTLNPIVPPGGDGVVVPTPVGDFLGSDQFPGGNLGVNPFYLAQRGDFGPGVSQFLLDFGQATADAVFGPNTFIGPTGPASTRSALRSRDNQYGDSVPFNRPEIFGISGRVSYEIGDYTLDSVTAYRETQPENFADFDLTTQLAGTQFRAEDHEQFVQEFQLSSPTDQRLQWIVGASYFEEDNDVRNEYLITSQLPVLAAFVALGNFQFSDLVFLPGFDNTAECCLYELNGTIETTAVSVFFDGTYDLTDALSLDFGVRYSYEERGGSNDLFTEAPTYQLEPFFNVSEFEDEDFDAVTPKLGLSYQATDNVFVYGSVARGFKSGGFNIGSVQNEPFDQEFVWSYEVGVRSDLYRDRLRLNASAFFYDYTDLQVQTVENNNIRVENASDAEITGLEISGYFRPVEGLEIDYAATWLDSEIKDFLAQDPARPALGLIDTSGNPLPKAPDLQWSLGIAYTFELGDAGSLTARAGWAFQDEIYFSQFRIPEQRQEEYDWYSAQISWRSPNERWRVIAFGDNLSDEEVVTNGVFNGGVSGQLGLGNLAPPRTFGATVIFDF
ncbi:MAG: TonB-dependent receptor [Pseudomonadota bacterium]